MDPLYTDALKEIEAVKAERDALAAHAELITRTARFLLQGLADDDQWRPNSSTSQIFNALIHDLDKGPATSLVRRDAINQEAAVKDFAKEVWEALMKSYRTQKVLPLTMAKHWIERNKPEGLQ